MQVKKIEIKVQCDITIINISQNRKYNMAWHKVFNFFKGRTTHKTIHYLLCIYEDVNLFVRVTHKIHKHWSPMNNDDSTDSRCIFSYQLFTIEIFRGYTEVKSSTTSDIWPKSTQSVKCRTETPIHCGNKSSCKRLDIWRGHGEESTYVWVLQSSQSDQEYY